MIIPPLRLGTRGSQLALWQAHYVADHLRPVVHPQRVELVIIETHGDQVQDRPLSQMGGFGVFTKAIQEALLENRIDVAVHSLKDLPTLPVEGLSLAAVPPRGPNGDAFISKKFACIADAPAGAVIGTSSLRRRAQLLHERPDLQLVDLRGNVDTRLRKLVEQDLGGIILAEAGLLRLGLQQQITEIIDPKWMLPAVGQGAIGLECRSDDEDTIHMVEAVNDPGTWNAVVAERAMLYALGGGCLVPIGVHTRVDGDVISIRGAVLSPDGRRRIVHTVAGSSRTPAGLGSELAAQLLMAGARELLGL